MKIKRVQFGNFVSLVGNNPKTVWEAGKDGIGSIAELGGQLVFFNDSGQAIRLVWPPPGTIATPNGAGESEHEQTRASAGNQPTEKQAAKARR